MISLLKKCVAIFSLNCTSWCKKIRHVSDASHRPVARMCIARETKKNSITVSLEQATMTQFVLVRRRRSTRIWEFKCLPKIITFTDFCSTDWQEGSMNFFGRFIFCLWDRLARLMMIREFFPLFVSSWELLGRRRTSDCETMRKFFKFYFMMKFIFRFLKAETWECEKD